MLMESSISNQTAKGMQDLGHDTVREQLDRDERMW